MRCSECGQEYADDSGACQSCGAVGLTGGPYREFPSFRGLGGLLAGLLAVTTEMIAAQLMLRAYGPASAQPWASRLSSGLGRAGEVALVLTAIVFVVWFYRARINAENSSWRQRRARGWTFWGWIVPIANIFVPFQLMGDIWRAGLPATRRKKTAWLPALWWTAWLLSGISEQGGQRSWLSNGSSQSGVPWLTTASSFSLCTLAISGALVIPVIRTVSEGAVAEAPAVWDRNPAQPRTRPKTPPLVAVALLAAVLGLAGAAAAAVGVVGASTYHADTVHLPAGKTVQVVLSPGIYRVWVGCANDTGCLQLRAGGLSVQGALDNPPVPPDGHVGQTVAGQPFLLELSFGIPAPESVRLTLHTRLSQPVFIAPFEDETSVLRGWIVVAAISGMVMFGLPVAAWLLTRRDTVGAA